MISIESLFPGICFHHPYEGGPDLVVNQWYDPGDGRGGGIHVHGSNIQTAKEKARWILSPSLGPVLSDPEMVASRMGKDDNYINGWLVRVCR